MWRLSASVFCAVSSLDVIRVGIKLGLLGLVGPENNQGQRVSGRGLGSWTDTKECLIGVWSSSCGLAFPQSVFRFYVFLFFRHAHCLLVRS